MLHFNFSPFPSLTTERLVLRRMNDNDFPVIFRLRQRIRKRSEEEIRLLCEKMDSDIDNNKGIAWGITLRGSDELIGDISFWRIMPEHHRAEIGYSLLPDHWRKGLATEAMKAVLKYGLETMKLHTIEANASPDNKASVALLEKSGFVREGYYRENFFDGEKFHDSVSYTLFNPRH